MKKKSLHPIYKAIVGTALVAAPALAFAGNGPYIGIEGGANWERPQNIFIGGAKADELHFKPGWAAGLVGGYSFANGFRPELELNFRRNELGRVVPATAQVGGFENAQTVMANLWYDFKAPTGFFSVVHPYIGGGVGGVRFASRHFVVAAGPQPNDWTTKFGYQGGAGIGVDLTQRLTMSADYRFIQSNRGSTQFSGASERYRANTAMLGVRYSFGAEPVEAAPPPPPPPPPPAEPVCTPPAGFKVDENCKIIPQKIILRSVNFKFNKATLTDAAKNTLDGVATALKQQPDLNVEIDGYTDSTGPAAYNKKLSQRRADSVRSYLISDGISGSTLHAQGFGKADPVASNKTRAGRTLNRRVQFTVTNAPAHVKVINKKPTAASVNAAAPK